MTLYPSQIEPLREALRLQDNGDFAYSTVLWSSIKKSAKSSIAAAVGLYLAFQRSWSSVKVIANDLKQADSRVHYYMRRAIELHPQWRDSVKITNYKIELPNHSIIEAIPIDPSGEAGGTDDLLIFSEIWAWKHGAAKKMWTEMTLSPTKYGKSMRWLETYAGYSGESPVLEQLYEQGVREGECIHPQYEMYSNKAARLFTLWNTQPHLPFQTPEYYAQESATLDPLEFNRVHRNQWISSEDVFVPSEWWTQCQRDVPAMDTQDNIVIGIDAAVSGDSFAMVAVSKRDGNIIVRYVNEWKPPKGGMIDFREPENELRRLIKEYRVVCVVYDAYQLHDMMTRLSNEHLAWFESFGQTRPRLEADKALYDMIRDRRIQHNGDSILASHVLNANRALEKDNKLRIVKRAEHLKIDCVVALSMCAYQAMSLNI